MCSEAHRARSAIMEGLDHCWGEARKLCAAASVAWLPVLASRSRYLIRYLRRQAANLRCDSSSPLPAVRGGCRPQDDSSSVSAELAPSSLCLSTSPPAALVSCTHQARNKISRAQKDLKMWKMFASSIF